MVSKEKKIGIDVRAKEGYRETRLKKRATRKATIKNYDDACHNHRNEKNNNNRHYHQRNDRAIDERAAIIKL